jgi:hypothetical protein
MRVSVVVTKGQLYPPHEPANSSKEKTATARTRLPSLQDTGHRPERIARSPVLASVLCLFLLQLLCALSSHCATSHLSCIPMAYAAPPEEHYRTSSLSHPSNSPFGRTSGAQSSRLQAPVQTTVAAPLRPFSAAQASSNGVRRFNGTSPFSVRPELDPLEREKREIERRRARLEDRKVRVLHAKTRVMGVSSNIFQLYFYCVSCS